MKIKFKKTDDTVAIPKKAIDLEPELSDLDLRLLFIIAAKGEMDDSELDSIAESLGAERTELDLSLSYLRGAGIISSGTRARRTVKATEQSAEKPENSEKATERSKKIVETAPAVPTYTAKEIEKIFASHSELAALLDMCQSTAGRVFNTAEANTVLVLRDHLKLEPEYILSLIAYCTSKGKTSMRYIEKMAYTLTDKGIDTPTALEDHLYRRGVFESREGELRRLFGLGERALTAREHAAFERWCLTWSISPELVKAAYETTINAIHEPSIPYTDKILEKWHAAGVKTPADVEKLNEKTKPAAKTGSGSFDTDDIFEAALSRTYGKINEGGGGA